MSPDQIYRRGISITERDNARKLFAQGISIRDIAYTLRMSVTLVRLSLTLNPED